MSDDRGQAIKDVGEAAIVDEHVILGWLLGAPSSPILNGLIPFAVAQRERVIALERALRGLDILLDFGDIIEPNTAQTFDDPIAINAAFAAARAALNGESEASK